jgi:2-oxoglutarate/2-oxoacid ferredoxin oxidoreductase subunit beta
MKGKEFKPELNGNGNGIPADNVKLVQKPILKLADIQTKEMPTWCPGCGDFNILYTLKNVLVELNMEPENTLIVTGIGCGSKSNHFIKTYGFEGLHGRALPVATGAKIANKDLNFIVVAGDGDTYGIGLNHFIHSMRRNLNITLIVQNNEVYGLTKGQTSPTSPQGFESNSTPSGVLEEPINPLSLAIASGATYVARGFAYDVKGLKELLVDGVRHKGFSLIDIFQPCTTYNRASTIKWYRDHIYTMENHDTSNKISAITKSEEDGEKKPIGVFYKADKPTYGDGLPQTNTPLVKHDIKNIDVTKLLDSYRF